MNPQLRKTLGARARRFISEKCDADKYHPDLMALYVQVIQAESAG